MATSSFAQTASDLGSFDRTSVAVVFGVSGGIGSALLSLIAGSGHFAATMGFGRRSAIPVDLTDEASLSRAVAATAAAGDIRLAIDATGFLHDARGGPEKSWRELDAVRLAHAFAINAIGPALLMKHLLPRLPRTGKAAFATLSARVGSIGDNRLGGWYGSPRRRHSTSWCGPPRSNWRAGRPTRSASRCTRGRWRPGCPHPSSRRGRTSTPRRRRPHTCWRC